MRLLAYPNARPPPVEPTVMVSEAGRECVAGSVRVVDKVVQLYSPELPPCAAKLRQSEARVQGPSQLVPSVAGARSTAVLETVAVIEWVSAVSSDVVINNGVSSTVATDRIESISALE
jgi:hypothetical protein